MRHPIPALATCSRPSAPPRLSMFGRLGARPLATCRALAGWCALAAGLAMLPAAAPAFADTVTAEANVARSEGNWGGELAVGMPVLSSGGFSITPSVGGFFHHRGHDGYSKDDGDCYRDSDGSQVGGGHCDSSGFKVFAKAEGIYRLPTGLGFGVGARFMSGDLRPYGTVMAPLLPHLAIKGDLGDHYLAAGLQARF